MAGVIKEHGKQERPEDGVILAFKRKTVEEINEKEDVVLQEIIGSKTRMSDKKWKTVVTYMREKKEGKYKRIDDWTGVDPEERILIRGDFNAIPGKKGGWK